jgi:hypothetical protein
MVITVSLDSTHSGGKVFFNDTVLEWLRAGVDAESRPYQILDVPLIDGVDQVEVTGDLFREASSGDMPGMPGGVPGRAFPGGRGPTPAPVRPRDEMPGRPAASGQGRDKPNTLEGLAPIEPLPPLHPEGTKVYRYTVRWLIGLQEKPTPGAGVEGDTQASAMGPNEVTS